VTEKTTNQPLQIEFCSSAGRFKTLAEIELEVIQETLKHFGNNKILASQSLGIAKSNLYRKLDLITPITHKSKRKQIPPNLSDKPLSLINDLPLELRIKASFNRAGVYSIEDFLGLSESALLSIHGLGRISIERTKQAIKMSGVSINDSRPVTHEFRKNKYGKWRVHKI